METDNHGVVVTSPEGRTLRTNGGMGGGSKGSQVCINDVEGQVGVIGVGE